MKLLELCKNARDEKWSDDKIELEVGRIKLAFAEELLKGLKQLGDLDENR